METNLTSRKRRLKTQIPDIGSSLILINKLRAKKEANEDTETEFLLSDSVYASARIPATEKVNWFMMNILNNVVLEIKNHRIIVIKIGA